MNNPGDVVIDQGADPLSAPQLLILHQVVCALGLYVVITMRYEVLLIAISQVVQSGMCCNRDLDERGKIRVLRQSMGLGWLEAMCPRICWWARVGTNARS